MKDTKKKITPLLQVPGNGNSQSTSVTNIPGSSGGPNNSANPPEAAAIQSRDQAESAKTDYDVGKWPRVLVITSQESQNLPIKEYAIRKAITGLTTNPRKLYQAKAGHYVVEVETDATSKTLLKTTVMAGHPVKVTPHRSLNSSRGVITSRFINGASDADLLDDLKDQGVTKAYTTCIKLCILL